jgi:hypothetical protein
VSDGRSNIKIFGDGRTYAARELARVIIEEEQRPDDRIGSLFAGPNRTQGGSP